MSSLRSHLKKILNETLLTESLSAMGAAWLLKSILENYDFWNSTYIGSKIGWYATAGPKYEKQETRYGYPQLVIDIENNMGLAEEIWYGAEGKQLEWLQNNFNTPEFLGEILLQFRIVLTQKQASGKRGHTYFDGELRSKNPKALKIRTQFNRIVVSINPDEQSLKNISPTGNRPLTNEEASQFAIETLHTRTTMLHEFHHWIQGKVYQPSQKLPQFTNQPSNMKENFYQLVIQNLIEEGGLEPADTSIPHHDKLYKILDENIIRNQIDIFNKQLIYIEEILLKKFDDMKLAWNNGTISQAEVEKLLTLVSPWFANKKNAFSRMRKKFFDTNKHQALTATNRKIFARECSNLSKEMNIEFFILTNDVFQKTNKASQLLKDGHDVYISYKTQPIRTEDDIRRGRTPSNKFSFRWEDYATELDAEIVTWLNQFILYPDNKAICNILLANDETLKNQILEFLMNNSLKHRFSSRNREANAYLLNKLDRIVQELIEVGMEFSATAQNQVQWNLIKADIEKFQRSNSTEKFSIATTSFLNRLKIKIKEHFGI